MLCNISKDQLYLFEIAISLWGHLALFSCMEGEGSTTIHKFNSKIYSLLVVWKMKTTCPLAVSSIAVVTSVREGERKASN